MKNKKNPVKPTNFYTETTIQANGCSKQTQKLPEEGSKK